MSRLDRFSKLVLSEAIRLRNRIVVPPMASQTADDNGFVTETTLQHYQNLSLANPGLLIVEYSYVHPTGKSEDRQLGVYSDAHVPGLRRLSGLIQGSGAIAGLQITHSGAKTEKSLTGGVLMGPSHVAVPVKDRHLEAPDAMTKEDMKLWADSFLAAVDRAVLAGFDLVEFHCAHGYGLNQWLSAITNQRDDAFGGDWEKRQRFILEIVAASRAKHKNLLISVRMPGQDFIPAGIRLDESIVLAKNLQQVGVNILHISSGIGGWRRPSTRSGEGYLVEEAAAIQAHVEIPVIGVGGIESGEYIDRALQENLFGLATVGRAILQNPRAWYEKNMLPLGANP